MNAIKCDICGKFFTVDSKYTMMTLEYNKNECLIRRKYYDVCAECTNRMFRIENKQPKEVTCATCDISDLNCHEQCKE